MAAVVGMHCEQALPIGAAQFLGADGGNDPQHRPGFRAVHVPHGTGLGAVALDGSLGTHGGCEDVRTVLVGSTDTHDVTAGLVAAARTP